ncbi:hypothetical protein ABZW10_36460 [Kitasatospora sp. NPDC004723]|uniref:hypothetical protein n=1 Tax=Kitasatospora sp. NPDC004723 TaxID=3154288 RepID=UPI0033A36B01
MSEEYRSWEEREATAAKDRAAADALKQKSATDQAAAAVELQGAKAATATKTMREQLAQAKLQQQLDEQAEQAKDAGKARQNARVEARAEAGTDFKRMVKVFVAVCMAAALPAQFKYFLGLHKAGEVTGGTAWLLGPLPIVLELAAWVAVYGTSWAGRKGMSKVPFWALTAALSGFAAWVNYRHGTAEYGSIAGTALAAASFAGPLMWELAEWLDGMAAVETRTREQRAADKAAAAEQKAAAKAKAEHDAKRQAADPAVWERFQMILIAHPLGAVDEETAWRQAWDDVHRAPLGVTAQTYARRVDAERALESVMGDERSVYRELDAWLGDVLRTAGDDGESGGGVLAPPAPKGPSPAPSEGAAETAKTLGGKGLQALRSGLQKGRRERTEKPLSEEHLRMVRDYAELVGKDGRTISTRMVRDVIGGGENGYISRLTRQVKDERGEK